MDKNPNQFLARRYTHWIDDHVRFSDLDPLGHVNNNSISQYFENARADLYREVTPNWPYGDYVFVLAHNSIDFRSELHMPAKLNIASAVTKIGRTSVGIANALFYHTEGIAYGESISVLINEKTRQPTPIPDELRATISRFLLKD
jgi:acyl-CoA thioester hydrolase